MKILSIVVMLYNERESLDSVVQAISRFQLPEGWGREIVIIDDGSTDGSSELADQWAAKVPAVVRAVHHAQNGGLGAVYRTGFSSATGDYLTFLPADGQYDMAQVLKLLSHCEEYDLVLGVLKKRTDSWVGALLSASERLLYRLLLGSTPPFQGILVFRRDALARVVLASTGRGWGVLLEFIIKAAKAGCRWCNVEIEVRARLHGESKVNNRRTIYSNLRQVWALRRIVPRG